MAKMLKNQLFSIVSVTLNYAVGLQKTGHSLRIQSFQDFEWIVVDGGSADGTRDYLAHTKANWTSQPDSGIYDAMNKGLKRASGDYIIFLNAGDLLASANTLARLETFIRAEKAPPDFIYGDSLESGAYKPARSHEQIRLGMFTHHQSMVYRRLSLHGAAYDTRYKIAADYDFTARALRLADACVHFPFAVCIFESGGVSQQSAARGRGEQFLIRSRLKISNMLENVSIYLLQAASWTARRLLPGFYWRVKSSGNRRRGFARI